MVPLAITALKASVEFAQSQQHKHQRYSHQLDFLVESDPHIALLLKKEPKLKFFYRLRPRRSKCKITDCGITSGNQH